MSRAAHGKDHPYDAMSLAGSRAPQSVSESGGGHAHAAGMGKGTLMRRWLLLLCMLLSLPCRVQGATRLGPLHTQEELWCVRQRVGIDAPGTHGMDCIPGAGTQMYKSLGDVSANSPGDWDRLVSSASSVPGNPTLDNWGGNNTGQP